MPIVPSINPVPTSCITSPQWHSSSVQSLETFYLLFDSRPDRKTVPLLHKLWKIPLTAQFQEETFQLSDCTSFEVEIDVPTGTIGEGWNDFIRAVEKGSKHWRIFEIIWKPTDLLFQFQGSSHPLHGLERLALHYFREDGNPTAGVYKVLFGREVSSPLLWIIRLGATYRRCSQMRSLAHNLVELHFWGTTNSHTQDTLGDIVDLLRASPRLQVLTFINIHLERTNPTNPPQPVNLQDLRRLGFRGGIEVTRDLLSLLRVPGLEKFHLGKCPFGAGSQDSAVLSTTIALWWAKERFMVPNQPGNLGELFLEYDECQEETMREFLMSTPGVEIFCTTSPTALPILARANNLLNILPALRHFIVKSSIFYGANGDAFSTDAFSTILTRRPGVTLYIDGGFVQDGEDLYNTLRLRHKVMRYM